MNPPLDTDESELKITSIVFPEDFNWVPAGTVPHNRAKCGALGVKPLMTYQPKSQNSKPVIKNRIEQYSEKAINSLNAQLFISKTNIWPYLHIVKHTGAMLLQPQVIDRKSDPTTGRNSDSPAAYSAVRVQIGEVGRWYGTKWCVQIPSTFCKRNNSILSPVTHGNAP